MRLVFQGTVRENLLKKDETASFDAMVVKYGKLA